MKIITVLALLCAANAAGNAVGRSDHGVNFRGGHHTNDVVAEVVGVVGDLTYSPAEEDAAYSQWMDRLDGIDPVTASDSEGLCFTGFYGNPFQVSSWTVSMLHLNRSTVFNHIKHCYRRGDVPPDLWDQAVVGLPAAPTVAHEG